MATESVLLVQFQVATRPANVYQTLEVDISKLLAGETEPRSILAPGTELHEKFVALIGGISRELFNRGVTKMVILIEEETLLHS